MKSQINNKDAIIGKYLFFNGACSPENNFYISLKLAQIKYWNIVTFDDIVFRMLIYQLYYSNKIILCWVWKSFTPLTYSYILCGMFNVLKCIIKSHVFQIDLQQFELSLRRSSPQIAALKMSRMKLGRTKRRGSNPKATKTWTAAPVTFATWTKSFRCLSVVERLAIPIAIFVKERNDDLCGQIAVCGPESGWNKANKQDEWSKNCIKSFIFPCLYLHICLWN